MTTISPISATIVVQTSQTAAFIAGVTAIAGRDPVTVGSMVYSTALDASYVVLDSSATASLHVEATAVPMTEAAMMIFSGITLTPTTKSGGATQYMIAGQTLVAGGNAITVASTTYSLAPGASNIVMDGIQTSSIGLQTKLVQITTEVPVIALAVTTLTSKTNAGGLTEYVVADQTLIAGGSAITVSSATYSLAPGVQTS